MKKEIVIVGGGVSGAAVAYHLLKANLPEVRVHIVEPSSVLGRGIAYSFESEVFRLNVPASKMSLDPNVPDDFVRFAAAEAFPNAFLSRHAYGCYVTERIESMLRESRSEGRTWRDEALGVAHGGEVRLRSGRILHADALVLATGLTPRLRVEEPHAGIVDAWDESALRTLPRSGSLLLLGAGLSALDVLAYLEAQGFDGRVTLVSRRGLLPSPHEEPFISSPPMSADALAAAPCELRALVRWVRGAITAPESRSWQEGVDQLRPHVVTLFASLSPRDRARFVRHVRAYWDAVRHRAPNDALDRVESLQLQGKLRRVAGRAEICGRDGAQLDVDISERSGRRYRQRFDGVVRCLGPALDIADGRTPLVESLLAEGLARITPCGLGIETGPYGSVVDASGNQSKSIFGIGAVCRASRWETTSVPDIATDAKRLAALLLS